MLLSRVADALYWMARYLERAEHTARAIDVRLDMGLDRESNGRWNFERLFSGLHFRAVDPKLDSPVGLLKLAVFDAANPSSVYACVTMARENARQVREELSSEMWEQVNGLYLRLKEAATEPTSMTRPHFLCQFVIEGVHLFQGVTDATMEHGEGWQYLQVGRFLERASATTALLDLHVRDGSFTIRNRPNTATWVGLLRSCCALEAYCRCYTADLRPDRIAEFLLLSSESPRSVRFSASRLESALRAISTSTARSPSNRTVRLAGRLHASLNFAQVDEILNEDPHAYLQGIERHCAQIHTALHQTYISYPIEAALIA